MELFYKFREKYGEPKEITIYPKSQYSRITFLFPKDRWVSIDTDGEMSWDGKKNEFNIK